MSSASANSSTPQGPGSGSGGSHGSGGFSFTLTSRIPGALGRTGVIHTPHGDIQTPNFAAVGTRAAVRHVSPELLRTIGIEVMLSNAYHLFRQAPDIAATGGLAAFSGWDGPTITDSGGFQVMSLGSGLGKVVSMDRADIAARSEQATQTATDRLAKVDDDGVTFRHYLDDRLERFTPEVSMQIQHQIGADIMMAFDELTSIGDSYDYNVRALERTRLWAIRCLAEHRRLEDMKLAGDRSRLENIKSKDSYGATASIAPSRATARARTRCPQILYPQALYGVLQGAHYQDLREQAARDLGAMDFDGYGLGGAFEKSQLGAILQWVNAILPEHKPRHLLGLSKPDDIFIGVEHGADTFDCVAPTREARHGRLYTRTGHLQLQNSQYRDDTRPIDESCDCPACAGGYTRAQLRAMYKDVNHDQPEARAAALTLLSAHNLRFTVRLFADIREAIATGRFAACRDEFLKNYYN
jgi:queuine tRNA-ribosyltransferase